ncbi:hypothetical protein [Pedobacter roseus]|uniref:Uncharacterized protein n=1 Tax=Pedobacter roseus TaxID=336820 RepID=A0A7G9QJ92_9SPHI|nr:hypothetical protein [Pedobacter roseus]QNN43417.1 hypothetical protein H9L23_04760 [Pedobacter roseus]
MTLKALNIDKPSEKVLDFVRKLQSEKEAKLKKLDSEREKYFAKKK